MSSGKCTDKSTKRRRQYLQKQLTLQAPISPQKKVQILRREATVPQSLTDLQSTVSGHRAGQVSNMSESGRSSPWLPESEAGDGESTGGSDPDPVTLNTADILTEEPFRPYKYRVEDFTPQEKERFGKIKKADSVDVPDDPGHIASADIARQISSPVLPPSPHQHPTDAFGKIHFQGEDRTGALPSWYVRMAVDTTKELIQELLEDMFEVINDTTHPLRIHCIDYNMWPAEEIVPACGSPHTQDIEVVITKLQSDLCSMCRKTAGIVLTWSGLGGDNIMHLVLGGIMEDTQRLTNMAAIATPPWSAVDPNVKERLLVKGGNVPLEPKDASATSTPGDGQYDFDDAAAADPDIPRKRGCLGAEISQYASHFWMLDDSVATTDQILSSEKEKSNFRHFHYRLIDAMEESEKKKTVKMPVVCVLINGYHDALKMVVHALDKKIPVLVVKGSGGYADIISDVYIHATLETTKYWDESDQVRTRFTKKAGHRGDYYLRQIKPKQKVAFLNLRKIFQSLDFITVYIPGLCVQTLDSVFFEALLKYKQEARFVGLVDMMQKNKMLQHPLSRSQRRGFIESDETQMDYFIEALKQNSVDVVKVFLERLKISEKLTHHFHIGSTAEAEELIIFRSKLMKMLEKLTVFPLRCKCECCPNCSVSTTGKSAEAELAIHWTCLHPIQELFLWTLHNRQVEMAVIFWKRCDDKIAAALVAKKVLWAMSKECTDPDMRRQIEQNESYFQDLAIKTLKSCQNMDEKKTELLLTKPCPWWGNLSVMQLGIVTENRGFIAQTACRNIMTRIWCGQPPSDPEMCGSDPEMHGRPCQLVNLPRQPDYACKLHRCSPRFQYCVNFVAQIAFLILYSYGLLFNFDQDITYVFISLIIWVAAVSVEELRQLLSKDSVLRDSSLEISKNTQTRVRAYFSQGWNWIDLVTIVLFWLGMVVFAPVYELQVFGRILLSIDVFFFFMRMFQMLMVFDELGLMLVMIYKMVKDTRNFMIILLVFVLAYAVASESLLYPESHVTGYRLFHLPRKAYWQVFGELMLDEIEIRDQDSCSVNDSMHLGSDDPHCPSKFGTYVVPILLGFHIMITNVLLLNLLIARFGVTFNKVHDEACEYQSWHRCQIITEYYSRTSLPPPLNLLHLVFYFLQFCCIKICQLCCCCRRKKQPENGGMELTSRRKEDRRCSHDSLGHSVSDVNQPLVNEGTVQAKLSADKRSVELTWDSSYDGWRHDDSRQQIYVVAINVSRDQQTPPAPDQFHIARKGGSQPQAFTIWNLDPQSKYIITVGDELVHQGRVDSSINAEHLQSTLEFEKEQAVRVCRSENTSSWSKELHSQMEIIGQEIGKITGGIKENHDALMKKMSSNTEGLKKVTKHSNENRDAFQKIDGNVEKLLKFLESNMKSMTDKTNKAKEKEKKAEKKRIEAEEKKEKAENKLKNAKAELERLQSEKEMMKDQAAPLEALQQKQQLMEQQQEQIHQILSQMQREQQQQQQQQVQQVLSQMQQEQQQQQLEQVQQTLTLIQQQQQQQQEQVQQTLMQIQEQQQLQVQQMLQVMQAVRSSAEGSHDANTQ